MYGTPPPRSILTTSKRYKSEKKERKTAPLPPPTYQKPPIFAELEKGGDRFAHVTGAKLRWVEQRVKLADEDPKLDNAKRITAAKQPTANTEYTAANPNPPCKIKSKEKKRNKVQKQVVFTPKVYIQLDLEEENRPNETMLGEAETYKPAMLHVTSDTKGDEQGFFRENAYPGAVKTTPDEPIKTKFRHVLYPRPSASGQSGDYTFWETIEDKWASEPRETELRSFYDSVKKSDKTFLQALSVGDAERSSKLRSDDKACIELQLAAFQDRVENVMSSCDTEKEDRKFSIELAEQQTRSNGAVYFDLSKSISSARKNGAPSLPELALLIAEFAQTTGRPADEEITSAGIAALNNITSNREHLLRNPS